MNMSILDQLWFSEDAQNEDVSVVLELPAGKLPTHKVSKVTSWSEELGGEIGAFTINPKRKMIEDCMGEQVMPILPHFIGMPETLVLQEIYAHLN